MTPRLIRPDEIRPIWDWIKTGLSKIQSKSPEQWISEDIYADCLFGKSMLWLFEKDKHAVGFVVLKPMNADTIHIWAAYAVKNGYLTEAFQHIKEIARHGKAKKITFDSWRKGWLRKSKQLGFHPRSFFMEI